ncbi:MAG: amino acid adenylation domain-containing protein [Verrucomicrobiales bacterium]|nr:amino acid adenylation domain-containing protein [Verrucomicrobiales bacterium]
MASKQSDDASRCYNEVVELKFQGELDSEALAGALQDVIDRHDGLRATFSEEGDGFSIGPELTIDIPSVDLSDLADDARAALYESQLDIEREWVFDLENGPLVRARIVQTGSEAYSLILNAHHLVCDGWSYNVVTGDLGRFYSARKSGEVLVLDPATSLSLFSLEASQHEKARVGGEAERFWISMFDEPVRPLDLPVKKSFDQNEPGLKGDRVTGMVDGDLMKGLKAAARKSGATTFSLMMGAFQILLGRLGRQDRVATFFPIAGQSVSEGMESMVGHCVNTLPVSSNLNPEKSIADFLREFQLTMLDCMENHDCTYGSLLKALPFSKRPSVDAIFNLEKMEGHTSFSGLNEQISEVRRRYSMTPLFLNALEREDEIELQFNFQCERFSRESVEGWNRSYLAILEEIVRSPEATIGQVRRALHRDDLEMLSDWSESKSDYPSDSTITSLFEETVDSFSESVAIQSDEGVLSYGALKERTDRIAHSLHVAGVKSGDRVGMFLDQSPNRIASLLAILKLGASYVPLDSAYPAERISLMVADSGVSIVISEEALFARIEELVPVVLDVVEAVEKGVAEKAPVHPADCRAESAAQVIYTSGSTGEPKGTVILHRGIVRLVRNTNYCRFGPDESILQAASISFDASCFEIFGALLNGGKLVLPPSGDLSLASIADAIQKHQVTTLWLTSGLFQLMVEEHVEAFSGVHQVLAGGDVVPVRHAELLRNAHPDIVLINGYGPTENSTFTLAHEVVADDLKLNALPVGRPIANTSVWILDPEGYPLPPGVAGELCCGGDGLALKYLNRPELTAEKFILANPDGRGERRFYRSGDLCRYRPDGAIEFLGRIDNQVKIRGFRVEPAEIEATLAGDPFVGQCKVVALGEGAAGKSLVAYVSPMNGREPVAGEMKAYLESQLPNYMVPSAFVVMDELPLNVNGKIDTKALPRPGQLSSEGEVSEAVSVEPATEMERSIAAIWSDILKVPDVKRDHNFFALGGHSLLGMRFFSRVQKDLGLQLPLSVLIKSPVLSDLAVEFESRQNGGVEAAADGAYQILDDTPENDGDDAIADTTVFLQPEGDLPPLFGVHGGDGGIFFYQGIADRLDPGRPFCAFEAAILTDGGEIKVEPVEVTAARYVSELKKVQKTGPYYLCGYSFGGVVAYEMACQLVDAGDEIAFLGVLDTWNPQVELRALSLAERIASNWNAPQAKNSGALEKAGKLGMRISTGLAYRVKFSTEGAVARALPSSKTTGWLRQVQVRQAYEAAMEAYHPSGLAGDLVLFRATEGNDKFEVDDMLGWGDVVDGNVSVIDLPGNHISMLHPANIDKVAEAVREALSNLK